MKSNTSNTPSKLRLALIFGGRSGEHDVSLMSARSVLSVLDPAKYEVTQIGITREGQWLTGEGVIGKFESGKLDGLERFVLSGDPSTRTTQYAIDVFFPVLHGTFGEDGTIATTVPTCRKDSWKPRRLTGACWSNAELWTRARSRSACWATMNPSLRCAWRSVAEPRVLFVRIEIH
ncbi:MAG: hypothetical protein U0X87_03970 [Anaerolineales bacterium]